MEMRVVRLMIKSGWKWSFDSAFWMALMGANDMLFACGGAAPSSLSRDMSSRSVALMTFLGLRALLNVLSDSCAAGDDSPIMCLWICDTTR